MKNELLRRGNEEKRRREDDFSIENLSEKKFFSSSPLLLFSFSLLHLAVALPLAYFLNIWADEASTLYTTERGFFFALQNALADEKQAPLYFWMLSLWREINSSIFFARIFSIIFSLLAIVFFYKLARRFFDEKAAFFITAFFALHPYLFWASLEIRVYSLIVFITILWLNLFFAVNFQSEKTVSSRREEILFVILSIFALYTNYYLGFLLVGGFVGLLILRKLPKAQRYFLQMLVVGVFFLPLLWFVKQQFAVNTSGFRETHSITEGLKILWDFFLKFTLPTELFPPEEQTTISVIRLWIMRLALIFAAVLLIKNRRKLQKETIACGALTAIIGAFLLIAYFALGKIYVEIRHASILFAPLIFTLGLFLRDVLKNEKPAEKSSLAPFLIPAFFVLPFFIYSVFTLYPNLTKRGDWARVGAFVEQNETENQPIIVFSTFESLALPYHYKGRNKIFPDEKFFDWELEAETGSAESWAKQIAFTISEIPPDAREIWLLTSEKCEIKDACQPLENFALANYTIVKEKDFFHQKVRLLRRKDR